MDYIDGQEIAIIGMTCRFPGANSIEEFWQNLVNKKESITTFYDEDLENNHVEKDVYGNSKYVKSGFILDDIDKFDAGFFGYTPREAQITDPQHRMFLECCWELLEQSGNVPEKYPGKIGVYAGVFASTYLTNLFSQPEIAQSVGDFAIRHGNDKDYLATRVSYKLNLKGPSVSIQTSCSSSLVSVHMAVQSLLAGECDMAISGGVSVAIPQKIGYVYQENGILSPDGHCRPFDADAEGTIFGNGLGIVLLKRLEDALKDGDKIYAVIKGSAINNDGAGKVGYTAPSVDGQAEVIAEAMALAGVKPSSMGMVEAHGTGTTLGDPVEISALTKAYRMETQQNQFCAIGSVKSNIGHLGAASGVAGFIKACLSLHHKRIPATINYNKPNPNINFSASPFYVNTDLKEWVKHDGLPRRAAVSSFGMGGTNSHVVLEEFEANDLGNQAIVTKDEILLISAKTETALDQSISQLEKYLSENKTLQLADVAHTLKSGRADFEYRASLVADSIEKSIEILEKRRNTNLFQCKALEKPQTVFLFPGQGVQYPEMGRGLYDSEVIYRNVFDSCCKKISGLLGVDLRDLLFFSNNNKEAANQLKETALAQTAIFSLEYALACLMRDKGVIIHAMIGHSLGEYVAATLAGVFSLEDALTIVAKRGKLMQEMATGQMLSVFLSEEEILNRLPANLDIAAVNGPRLCVVSGTAEAIQSFNLLLLSEGVETRVLVTSHAFHSKMMEPILSTFEKSLENIVLNAPSIPYISNVTGDWIQAEQATDPKYWVDHIRKPVLFSKGLKRLLEDAPNSVFLEVGPGNTLSGLAQLHTDYIKPQYLIQLVRHAKSRVEDGFVFRQAKAKMWSAGIKVNWTDSEVETGKKIKLPAYPFERQSYWVEQLKSSTTNRDRASAHYPQIFKYSWLPSTTKDTYTNEIAHWYILGDVENPNAKLLVDAISTRLNVSITNVNQLESTLESADNNSGRKSGAVFFVNDDNLADIETLLDIISQENTDGIPVVKIITWAQCSIGGLDHSNSYSLQNSRITHLLAKESRNIFVSHLDFSPPHKEFYFKAKLADAWVNELQVSSPGIRICYKAFNRYVWVLESREIKGRTFSNQNITSSTTFIILGSPNCRRSNLVKSLAANGFKKFAFLISKGDEKSPSMVKQLIGLTGASIETYTVDKTEHESPSMLLAPIMHDFPDDFALFFDLGLVENFVKVNSNFKDLMEGLTDIRPALICQLFSLSESGSGQFQYWMEQKLIDVCGQYESFTGITCSALNIGLHEIDLCEDSEIICSAIRTSPHYTQVLMPENGPREKKTLDVPSTESDIVDEELKDINEGVKTSAFSYRGENVGVAVTEIWKNLFGIEGIKPEDDYFSLGGTSLIAIQLISKIRDTFSVDLNIEDLFEDSTLGGVIKMVEKLIVGKPVSHGDSSKERVIVASPERANEIEIDRIEEQSDDQKNVVFEIENMIASGGSIKEIEELLEGTLELDEFEKLITEYEDVDELQMLLEQSISIEEEAREEMPAE